ncbi:MAG: radical SAM protein [Oscillospiraceae bacterium]|nr:radical SAM protein [Oscillospiraceae bacterium]
MKIDIKRIEFVITHSCTGNCKHCSAVPEYEGSVDAEAAVQAVKRLTSRYKVESIMTFGGEPLLYADTVCKIFKAAQNIPKRQIITNGYFSNDEKEIESVAAAITANDILISVDAFHQEYIPLEPVIHFAKSLTVRKRVHPAWLINEQDDNPYNIETKRLLKIFNDMGIESTPHGNNIFPAGRALQFFPPPEKIDLTVPCGEMPYTGRLDEIECVSIEPNGDLTVCSIPIGNIYKDDVLSILDNYDPYANPLTSALLEGGVAKLLEIAGDFDISDCYTACGVCRKIMKGMYKL